MKRSLAVAAAVVFCLVGAQTVVAGEAGDGKLPLRRVVLFTSGVGYFEHIGTVNPPEPAVFYFRPLEMVDVIRSLVVLDRGPGSVTAGIYDGREPVSRTLKSLLLDLSDNPALHVVLQRLRGREVTLKTVEGPVRGRVVSVEKTTVVKEGGQEEHYRVNLFTDGGLRRLNLEDVSGCVLEDGGVASDVVKALDLLAAAGDRQCKALRLVFGGSPREVGVGYLRETPVWKTSYRLVKQGEKTLLQGWAHVENTTEGDWENVRLILVSGEPISFIQNLYDPVFIKRPEIPLPEAAALQPVVHEDRVMKTKALAEAAPRVLELRAAAAPAAPMYEEVAGELLEAMTTVEEAAAGVRKGEVFAYQIEEPVTLGRNQGAMVPIVNSLVAAEWATVINPKVNQGRPMNCVVVSNTTGNFLKSGPVTVFEEGVYAGEGLLSNVPEGETKVISYAGDPRTVVDTQTKEEPEMVEKVKIRNGTMEVSVKRRVTARYALRNRRDTPRIYLIEHPKRRGWELVEPAGEVESTPDFYRIRVVLAAGQSRELLVSEERLISRSYLLTTLGSDQITYYSSGGKVSQAVRSALEYVARQQQEIKGLKEEIRQKEQALKDISQEQARIRENMQVVRRSDTLYQRYLSKLTEQEDQVDRLQAELGRLREKLRARERELEQYLMDLNVE